MLLLVDGTTTAQATRCSIYSMRARDIILEMGKTPTFLEGDYVQLHNPDPEIPDELGTIEWDEGDGYYAVKVDDKYLEGEEDDGIREVTYDQMTLIRRGRGVYEKPPTPGLAPARNYAQSRGQDPRGRN